MISFNKHDPDTTASSPFPKLSSREKWLLSAILLLAFALRLVLPNALPSIYYPDEIFQYLEQGHRLVFGYGVVPWEYRLGLRSWLLPGFIGGLMWLATWFGGGAAAYMATIAAVMSAFSLSIVAVAFLWARRIGGPVAALLAALITATWFELVYFGSKPLTEVVVTGAFFSAAYLLCSSRQPSLKALLFGGALLGLSFVLRIHLAPAILAVAIAGCGMAFRQRWLPAALAGATVFAAAGLLDWATWDYPFQSFWLNFKVNVLLDKASSFGVSPWYGYIGAYVQVWSWFLLPLALLFRRGMRQTTLLWIVPVIIFVTHSMIGHKEYRFLFPALPFILTLAAIGTAAAIQDARKKWQQVRQWHLITTAIICWGAASIILVTSDGFRPNLYKRSAEISAFISLRNTPSTCAVALIKIRWGNMGGYTYLHRNIPIYLVRDMESSPGMHSAFNTILAPSNEPLKAFGYHRERCYRQQDSLRRPFPKLCIFIRAGTCKPQPDQTINPLLIRNNK